MLAAACAGPATLEPERHAPGPAVAAGGQPAWWGVRFRIAWDRAAEPAWHVDPLLASRVLSPVLASLEPRPALWRFHRRAAPDDVGHQLSFLFFAAPDTARRVNAAVAESPVVNALLDAGILTAVLPADLSAPGATDPGATSDEIWPAEIKQTWPYFIMGVSASWLRLVEAVDGAPRPAPEAAVPDLLARYRDVNDRVNALWRDQGQHVYLHHLNALFGYRPLIIRGPMLRQF